MSDMLGGPAPAPRRSRAAGAWIAAIVAVALLGTAAWLVLRPAAEPEAAAVETSAAAQPAETSAPAVAATPAADFAVSDLPTPDMVKLLPDGLPLAKIDSLKGLPGSIAIPKKNRTPVWTGPDAAEEPVLALESAYYDADGRWLVLDEKPGWVKVLIPYGRSALPSQDPDRVNGTAGWVQAKSVVLEQEKRFVVVDLSDRTLTVRHADGTDYELPTAIGAADTPTPKGLTQVFTVTEAANTGLSVFLSMQSEALDGFYGNDYAATAIHVGEGQGEAVSNGCLRLTNADFDRLDGIDPGVPVLIKE